MLGLGLDLHYFSIFFTENKEVSTLSFVNFTDGSILLTERTHTITITYSNNQVTICIAALQDMAFSTTWRRRRSELCEHWCLKVIFTLY